MSALWVFTIARTAPAATCGCSSISRSVVVKAAKLYHRAPAKPLGLTPEAMLARQPRLVLAATHGWRADGPYGGRPAYDDLIQGVARIAGHRVQ